MRLRQKSTTSADQSSKHGEWEEVSTQVIEFQDTLSSIYVCTTIEMASTSILAQNLFNVNGLVAVITGGGTGLFQSRSREMYSVF